MDPRVVQSTGTSVALLWAFTGLSALLAVWLLLSGSPSSVLWGALGLASARLALRRCVLDGGTWHVRGLWRTHHVPVEQLTAVEVDDPMLSLASHTVAVSFDQQKVGVAAFAKRSTAEEAVATMRATLPPGHPLHQPKNTSASS